MAPETPHLGPLLLEPRFVPKLWGGRRLQAFGKALPPNAAIGESWELYDDAQGSALVTGGPAAGKDLNTLMKAWGPRLMGSVPAGAHFPLLVKLLDALQDLSVQVHPDDALARALHGPAFVGKSEMWVVLEAEPGACVYSGFKDGVDLGAFEAALAKGDVMGLLRKVPVKAGDVIDIPAGRVHAIGAGCLLAEVQQNSDLTYRVWDFGRLENGRPRELHLEAARKALHFDALGCSDGRVLPRRQPEPWGSREELVQNAYFKVQRWALEADVELPADRPAPAVLMLLAGEAALVTEDGSLALGQASTCLVPAELGANLRATSPGTVLLWIEP